MPTFRAVPWKKIFGRNPAAAGPALLQRYSLISTTTLTPSFLFSSRTFTYRNLSHQQANREHAKPSLVDPTRGKLEDESLQKALDAIWFHIHKNKARDAPDRALETLEFLIDQQALQSKPLLQKGVVINTLRYCQKQSLVKPSSLGRLERVKEKLEQNGNLWDEKVPSLILMAMSSCWNSRRAPLCAERILLKELDDPRQDHYVAVLNGYAQHGMAGNAEHLLRQLEKRHTDGVWAGKPPNCTCYNCVINALARSRERDALQRAEAILRRMEETEEILPDEISYSTLLHCYTRRGMLNEAENLLEQMEDRHKAGLLEKGPNTTSFNIVLNALAKSRERDAPQRTEAFLAHMLEIHAAGNAQVHPDKYTVGAMLRCYANHRDVKGAYRFAQQMHELHRIGDLKDRPSTEEYNALLTVFAKSKKPDAGQQAEDILNLMHELHSSGHPRIQPDSMSYAIALNCYAQMGQAEKAIALLQQMHDKYDEGELKHEPNTSCYNTAINAVANSSDPDAAELAKAIVYRMQLFAASFSNFQPDVITFNSLLKVYAKAGLSSEAEETLQDMRRLRDYGDLKDGPNIASYRLVIQLLAKSGDRDSLYRAVRLLDEIFEFLGGRGVDIKMFTMLLDGYANLGLSREAEQLLERMNDIYKSGELKQRPNNIPYNCVLKSLAICGDWDAPERAEKLLSRMRHRRIDPCLVSYNNLLAVYAKEGMVRECEQTLQQIHDLYDNGALERGPNAKSYALVMGALANCGGRDTCAKAETLLKRMGGRNPGVKADEGIKRSFLVCFERRGKRDEGCRIWDQLNR